MANRYRANFLYGVLSGFNNSQTTFTGTGFPSSIPTGYYLPIIINPGYNGSATASGEVVYVTNITGGNVITVSGRGFEGTTAITGTNGTAWLAGPLVSDFDVSNLTSSGTLTLSGTGGLTVSGTSNLNGGLNVLGTVSLPSNSIPFAALATGVLPAAITTSKVWNPASTTTSTGPVQTGISGYNNYVAIAWSRISYGSGTVGNLNLSISGNGTASINAVAQGIIPNVTANAMATTFAYFSPGSGTSFSVQCVPSSAALQITGWNNYLIVVGLN